MYNETNFRDTFCHYIIERTLMNNFIDLRAVLHFVVGLKLPPAIACRPATSLQAFTFLAVCRRTTRLRLKSMVCAESNNMHNITTVLSNTNSPLSNTSFRASNIDIITN